MTCADDVGESTFMRRWNARTRGRLQSTEFDKVQEMYSTSAVDVSAWTEARVCRKVLRSRHAAVSDEMRSRAEVRSSMHGKMWFMCRGQQTQTVCGKVQRDVTVSTPVRGQSWTPDFTFALVALGSRRALFINFCLVLLHLYLKPFIHTLISRSLFWVAYSWLTWHYALSFPVEHSLQTSYRQSALFLAAASIVFRPHLLLQIAFPSIFGVALFLCGLAVAETWSRVQ